MRRLKSGDSVENTIEADMKHGVDSAMIGLRLLIEKEIRLPTPASEKKLKEEK